jgi:hypothetical protein
MLLKEEIQLDTKTTDVTRKQTRPIRKQGREKLSDAESLPSNGSRHSQTYPKQREIRNDLETDG